MFISFSLQNLLRTLCEKQVVKDFQNENYKKTKHDEDISLNGYTTEIKMIQFVYLCAVF